MEKKLHAVKIVSKSRDIAFSGLLIAMVFVATRFINIRLPISVNGGLIHLGNVMLFATAIVFGKKKGALAGAFGMGIFDIFSPYMIWAPFTFVIRGVMGLIVGSIAYSKDNDGDNVFLNVIGIILSGIWMIGGYYVTEGILYGNWITPVTSIPGNVAQLVVGLVFGIPLAIALKRVMKKANLI